ncbi:MAG: histidinol dehydrogenase [Clostridiales bacterium]|nr:histidinol dehydrogenase [Clostridiales bacterium]
MINISAFSFDNSRFLNILNRQSGIPHDIEKVVTDIIEDVRVNGDEALNRYMLQFDQIDLTKIDIQVSREEIENARQNIPPALREAIAKACDNIKAFHQPQLPENCTVFGDNEVVLERRYRPLNRVAVTVPGENAPLLSTLYMNLIPALVAGVPDICIITKPKNGKIHDALLFTADLLNISTIYKISGAQGIAAMAYGTKRIKKADAIVGPGNIYTQAAKKRLTGTVKIDSLAGPSEIVIIADEMATAAFAAADLLSQAEHGTGFEASTAFCLSFPQAEQIKAEVIRLAEENNLDSVIPALGNYGDIFVVEDLETAVKAANLIAPEHVELLVKDPETLVSALTNAGAVFVGDHSPESVGDYLCGTNHILPTCGTARFSSGLNVMDFLRSYRVIRYTEQALRVNAERIKTLADAEGMKAHALAVDVRLRHEQK